MKNMLLKLIKLALIVAVPWYLTYHAYQFSETLGLIVFSFTLYAWVSLAYSKFEKFYDGLGTEKTIVEKVETYRETKRDRIALNTFLLLLLIPFAIVLLYSAGYLVVILGTFAYIFFIKLWYIPLSLVLIGCTLRLFSKEAW